MIAVGVVLRNLHGLQLLQPGLLGNLVFALVGILLEVAHIGDVAHIADLVSEVREELEKDVVSDARAGVPEVRVTIDGRSADIHPHPAFVHGLEDFLIVTQCVGNSKNSHKQLTDQ